MLSKLIGFVEQALSVTAKVVIGLGIFLSFAVLGVHVLKDKENDITVGAVMITNFAGNGGGTGVILNSSGSKSTVLTNSHVCRVVENGGVVNARQGRYMVIDYKHSKLHDICLLSVNGDLNYSTKVAARPPVSFYEKATISGHPALLPNVVTSGHFSGRKIIQVMSGLRPCADKDLEDPNTALFCLLAGGVPIIKQYESVLVTATIMPGSSGSGVYNEKNELVGLAFAGSGDLGYAWTVPFEALTQFLNEEEKAIEPVRAASEIDLSSLQRQNQKSYTEAVKNLREACKSEDKRSQMGDYCTIIESDLTWVK